MSEILVNTIKKADGTGSITVPANTGTLVDTSGADFTGQVTTTSGMGVGTASPTDSTLHAKNSSSGSALKVESNTGNNYINFYDGATRTALVGTADGSTNNFYVSNEANTDMLFRTNGSERMRIDSSGNVGIGITNPSRPLDVYKTGTGSCAFVDGTGTVTSSHTILDVRFDGTGSPATSATYIRFGDADSNNGSITVNGGSVAYNTSSDYRKKENVVDLTDGIDRVKQLDVHRFNWIGRDETVDGFLAHEVQTVVPEAVTGTHNEVDDEGNPVYQGIDQSKLVPLLTGALQEAIAKIETLETTVADLQTRVTALETP